MARYLLDTSTLIDFVQRHEPVASRIDAMIQQGDLFGICAVNLAELYAGFFPDDIVEWVSFVGTLAYWDISPKAAMNAGQDRFRLARQGRALATPDALIAAVAREQEAIVITENQRHFSLTGIPILSLRG